jgi:hypothetical protein
MDLREVNGEMIGSVKAFLANREDFRDANDWDGLFNYPWKPEGFPYGYVILKQERIVGFLGTIFSERVIAGKVRICCNTTSWFVEEEFRTQMQALQLFAPILRMKDLLITNMSPTDRATAICEKLGYKYLDHEQVVIPVLPTFGFWSRKRLLVSFDPSEIERHLNSEQKKILQDHAGLACKHFLIKERYSGQYCYGIATTTPLRRLRLLKGQWLNLCYLSDASVFTRAYRFIRNEFWREGRFFLLRYDARLLPRQLSRIAMRSKKTRQYKSREPLSWIVDNLYSELVTFNKY